MWQLYALMFAFIILFGYEIRVKGIKEDVDRLSKMVMILNERMPQLAKEIQKNRGILDEKCE